MVNVSIIVNIFLVILIFASVIIVGLKLYKDSKNNQRENKFDLENNYNYVIKKIKNNIPNFEEEKFLRWVKDIITTYEEGYSKEDLVKLSAILKKEFYYKVEEEIKDRINNAKEYVVKDFCVLSSSIMDYKKTDLEDIIYVCVKVKMIEYLYDKEKEMVINGDSKLYTYKNYQIELTKKKGCNGDKKDTNCKWCGAIIKLTSEGKCQNCGRLIVTDEHDFAISDIKEIFI